MAVDEHDAGGAPSSRRDSDATDLSSVYEELRALAASYIRRERPGHTLQPTALVNEAFVKLAQADIEAPGDSRAFRALAAHLMRQILVDHARSSATAKRGGGRLQVTFHDAPAADSPSSIDLLALDEALTRLAALDERKSRVVELRFFGGLTNAEIAHHLGFSSKTTEADWYMARAWLRSALADSE